MRIDTLQLRLRLRLRPRLIIRPRLRLRRIFGVRVRARGRRRGRLEWQLRFIIRTFLNKRSILELLLQNKFWVRLATLSLSLSLSLGHDWVRVPIRLQFGATARVEGGSATRAVGGVARMVHSRLAACIAVMLSFHSIVTQLICVLLTLP